MQVTARGATSYFEHLKGNNLKTVEHNAVRRMVKRWEKDGVRPEECLVVWVSLKTGPHYRSSDDE